LSNLLLNSISFIFQPSYDDVIVFQFTIVVSAVCLGVAGIGSIFPGIIWAHLVFAIGWATQLGLNTPTFFQLSKEDSRYHAEFEDLIPQLSDDEIQVLEKAKEANFQSGDAKVLFSNSVSVI
jgi:hypothetical protein